MRAADISHYHLNIQHYLNSLLHHLQTPDEIVTSIQMYFCLERILREKSVYLNSLLNEDDYKFFLYSLTSTILCLCQYAFYLPSGQHCLPEYSLQLILLDEHRRVGWHNYELDNYSHCDVKRHYILHPTEMCLLEA